MVDPMGRPTRTRNWRHAAALLLGPLGFKGQILHSCHAIANNYRVIRARNNFYLPATLTQSGTRSARVKIFVSNPVPPDTLHV